MWEYRYLFVILISVILDIYAEVGLFIRSYDNPIVNTLRNHHTDFEGGLQFYNPTSSSHYIHHVLANIYYFLWLLFLFYGNHPIGYLNVALICISMIICNIEDLFICFLVFCISSMEKYLFMSLVQFLIG